MNIIGGNQEKGTEERSFRGSEKDEEKKRGDRSHKTSLTRKRDTNYC